MQCSVITLMAAGIPFWQHILSQYVVSPNFHIYTLVLSASPTVTSVSTPIKTDANPAPSIFNPTILVSLIGLGGIIVGALIAGGFALYQQHRAALAEQQQQEEQRRFEQQRQEEQRQFEQQRQEEQLRFEQQQQEKQFQHEQELELLRRELDVQFRAKEQEEQTEAERAETLRRKMLHTPNSERAKAYRQALHFDSRISRLQILGMNRPLEVTNVFVRVRVHQESRSIYELDPAIRLAETQRDPNALLKEGFKHLERRVSSAIDPDEAIRTYKRCVFVGDPGAGKTTLLKYLTLRSADSTFAGLPNLPIRIELNAFSSSGCHDVLDFAANDWDERYGFPKSDARALMEECLKDGDALLLLDAIDETVIGDTTEAAESSYQRVATAISQLATRYPQAPIVVTARKAGYQQRAPLVGFTELEVLDFRLEDMQQFVTNWFGSYQNSQKSATANDLNVKLENNPRIQALGANPLLLSLIVLVYEAQLDLPDRRAELYKRCVDTLLTEWDAQRNIRRRREFKPEHKRQLLAEIAWHFHLQGRRYFPESEVLKVIADFLPKVHLSPEQNGPILAEIANEQGLLKEQARGWQGFLHLTLQEYFVAQYVTDYQQLDTLLSHRGDPWWEEVLILFAGYTSDASPLLLKLLGRGDEQLREDVFQTNLVLAGRCLAARPTIHQISLWETIIDQLFQTLITTPYSLTQALISEALAAIGGVAINKQLLQLLSNKQIDLNVRGRIAESLGRSGEHAIVPELAHLLSDQQIDLRVRERLAEALGRSGGRIVVLMLTDKRVDIRVREHIAEALGYSEERLVVPKLLQLLLNKEAELSVLERIADSLGMLGEHSIAPALLQMLANEQIQLSIREHVALALGTLGNHSIASDLLKMLTNKQIDLSVRMCIADSLGMLRERSITSDLLQILTNKQIDLNIREHVALALGTLGNRSIAPDLLKMLTNKQIDLGVRKHLALALGLLGEHSITTELIQLLSNEQVNMFVRICVAEALCKLGDSWIVPELVPLLSNEHINESVRESIATTLGTLGKRSVAPELVQLLSNERINESVRESIATALGTLGERSIVPELMQLRDDEQINVSVRARIRDTLVKLGKYAMMPEVAQLFPRESMNASAQERINEVMSKIEERAPELVQVLLNKQVDLQVREQIAEALSHLGENRNSLIQELIKLITNNQIDQDVRGHIATALGTLISDEESVRILAMLLLEVDIINQIHHALWTASRRVGVRIFLIDTPKGKYPEVVSW